MLELEVERIAHGGVAVARHEGRVVFVADAIPGERVAAQVIDAGRERFHVPDRPSFMMKPNDPVLYFLQRLRDEAHRFAVGSHRTRRAQGIAQSALDDIPGVGAARKRALLHHFGSGRAVGEAGLADLEMVKGISRPLAKKIYDHFHGDS